MPADSLSMTTSALLRLAESPLLLLQPDFLTEPERAKLLDFSQDEAALETLGCEWSRGPTGTSTHVAVELHPVLRDLEIRIAAVLGLDNSLDGTFRLRKYAVGQSHPPHLDLYAVGDAQLLATALVCLESPGEGGETVFLDGEEGPLRVAHQAGQLLAWHNLLPTGEPVAASAHLAAPVTQGTKQILAMFIYGEPATLRQANRGTRAPDAVRQAICSLPQAQRCGALRGFGRALAVIDDGVPRETVQLVEQACADRGIRVVHVDPRQFDYEPDRVLRAGDMVYRPAISLLATRVEQHLWHNKVASFYLDTDGPLFANLSATETFIRAGLPVPRSFWLDQVSRPMLRKMVDACGGLPVVVKAPGYSRGVGVMRADSLPTLFSIVDFAAALGVKPQLTAYVPDAVHWRVIVVGDKAVGSYRNVTDPDDFRTSGSDDPSDYSALLPPGAAELAIAACRVLRHAHGGVDILEHPASGRLYLLEANFPCYYAQAQESGGDDVAGAMVQYLLERAEELAAPSTQPLPHLTP